MPQEFLENIRTLDRCRDWGTRYPQNALVVLVDNQVIGFVCYGVSNQADLENAGELYALYVLADYYGKKIGYQLMQVDLKKMQSFDKIALWVLEGNVRAIAFYEKIGFRFDGVTKTVKLGVDRVEHRMVFRK
ncbi:GNAT family N-acetyltransferase [Streptococcus ruminantium]|uniref:GNAT family N-acetyltransferase n=1 Tax=Streptococcus ruminantium TaxID=1917441 RepID=UPI001D152692|nr:GNAT family N-acetyltransferase [Streptococcus ruminantium]